MIKASILVFLFALSLVSLVACNRDLVVRIPPDVSHERSGSSFVKIYEDGDCSIYRDNPNDNTISIVFGICKNNHISIIRR